MINRISLSVQPGCQARRAVEGRSSLLFIDQSHKEEILFTFSCRFIVEAGPGQIQQFALAADAELGMLRFNQLPFSF